MACKNTVRLLGWRPREVGNLKAAIYARVSTEDQAERATIENQIDACTRYAGQQGWDVVAQFRDEGVSGAVPLDERTQGAALLAGAARHEFDRVIMLSVDRLTRNNDGVRNYNQLHGL